MDWFGRGESRPSEGNVSSFVPAFAAVRTLADTVASAPIDQYRRGSGIRVPVETSALFVTPSYRYSLFEWLWQMIYSLAWNGNAYGLIMERDPFGFATKIEWLDPGIVRVDAQGFRFRYWVNGEEKDAANIVHVRRYSTPGSATGIEPVIQFARALRLGVEAERFGYDWFRNGGHPSAVIYSDQVLTPETAKTVKDRALKVMRGSREPLVLGAGLRYERSQANAAESAFLESHSHAVREASRIWGVPPELIAGDSGGNSITYSNIEQRLIGYNQLTARSWVTQVEQVFSSLVPMSDRIKLNLDANVRVDLKTRTDVEVARVTAGLSTPNEERIHEDMPPLPGGSGNIPAWPPFAQQKQSGMA